VFSILLIAPGWRDLRDRSDAPVFLVGPGGCALRRRRIDPTGFIIFFKHGPLAWSGIIGWASR